MSDALGESEVRLAKKFYGWPEDARFLVPYGVYARFAEGVGKRGHAQREKWQSNFEAYPRRYPELAEEIARNLRHELPNGRGTDIPSFLADPKGIATREASGKVLNSIGPRLPWLMGGAAHLATSTKHRIVLSASRKLSPSATPKSVPRPKMLLRKMNRASAKSEWKLEEINELRRLRFWFACCDCGRD